jgi:hypothetical protein
MLILLLTQKSDLVSSGTTIARSFVKMCLVSSVIRDYIHADMTMAYFSKVNTDRFGTLEKV